MTTDSSLFGNGRGLTVSQFVAAVRGRLIVSCQASEGHPMRDTATLVRFALAARAGGAAAIRCGGVGEVADIVAIRAALDGPVIGLTKTGGAQVSITPTVSAALAVVAAGADVVALDATGRDRPDGRTFADAVRAVHGAGRLVMADVATEAQGVRAAADGADVIATTLAGYVGTTPPDGPDVALVHALRSALPDVPVFAEGRYHSPSQAAEAIAAGATAVVVGTAITDPVWITAAFAAAVESASKEP